MRYLIPHDEDVMKKESAKILQSFVGPIVERVDNALNFIKSYSDGNHIYKEDDYDALYRVYKDLGLADGYKQEDLFPLDKRDEYAFSQELQKLWQIFELHVLDRGSFLTGNRRDIEIDRIKCREMIMRQQDIEQEIEEAAHEEAKDKEEQTQIIDEKSPDFEYVAGTLYEELLHHLNKFEKQIDMDNYGPAGPFVEDMTNLLSQMQKHYVRRNNMGSYVPMNQEDYHNIRHLYQECLNDMRRFPSYTKMPDNTDELKKLLIHNELQLNSLSDNELPALAAILDNEPVETIQLQETKNKTIGGALSSREAIEYTDKEGIQHRGFFTADTQITEKQDAARQILKKYQDANPKYADFFAKFVNFDEDYNYYRALIVSADWVRTKKDPLALSKLYETQSKNMGLPEDANLGEAFKSFADELLKNDMIANVYNLSGLHAGDHIAERSGAMTDVAKALGFSELLAGSKRAVVERGGERIHGVMMEPAALDSVDVQYLTKDSSILKVDPKEFDSKVMLSSLADLQIIDYLCANTDRHANNFFVRQDASDADHPKLIGVVGIDNDNSFGDINDGGVLKLAKSDELKIITPKMADAISSMTDKRLHEILDEYNLSENEIKSAEKRLATLKDMISAGRKSNELKFEKGELVNEKGTIHIVKDDEWDSLTLNSLVPQSVAKIQANGNKIMEKNLFYIAAYRRNDIAERAKKLNMDNPPEEVKTKDPIVYTTHKVQMNFDKISLEQENELNQLSKIVNGLSGYGADESSRSAKFKDMWNKLNSFISDYVALKQSTKSDDVEPGMRTKEQELKERYKSLNKKRDILAESIDRYLNKKHFKLSITERNQHRIDLAVKLADFVKAPPQSQVYLENETVKMEQHKAQFNSKTVHQLNSYVTNQIYSKMRDTLRNNVQALPDGDKKRGLGINAIRAHERLWKYGQTDGVSHKDNSNKDEKTRERVSINQLNDEVKREANGKTDIDQICNDLNTLVKYEPKLGKKIKNMVENKSKITPRQVKGVLQDLLVIGSEKGDMQKTEVKEKTVKVVRKKK